MHSRPFVGSEALRVVGQRLQRLQILPGQFASDEVRELRQGAQALGVPSPHVAVAFVWNVETGDLLRTLNGSKFGGLVNVVLSADERFAVTTYFRQTSQIRVWNLREGKILHVIDAGKSSIFRTAFLPGTNRIVFGAYDGRLQLWDTTTGETVGESVAVDRAISLAVAPDGKVLVGTSDGLLHLVNTRRISRETVSGLFLYCCRDSARKKQQVLTRKTSETQPSLAGGVALGRVVPDELKAAIILFFALLDEKQRRLYAGLESLKFGHGGDRKIAELLGIDVGTVARGRQQLRTQDAEVERVRKSGGGRKAVEKKRRRSSRQSKRS